jgi:putative YphP/YqiW family bacilliredoxin
MRDATHPTRPDPLSTPTMYDPELVQPFRDEVTSLGVKELLTPAEVDKAATLPGTTLIFVNSVCGCAAAGARPALRLALMNQKRPVNLYTVFAGMEREATEKAREYFKPYRPSSPQIALLKDGKLIKLVQRQDIEGRDAHTIAKDLAAAFDAHC